MKKHIPAIHELIKNTGSKTVLDYGAGQGMYHKHRTDIWGVTITLYDPAVKRINVLPDGHFDGVICTDVLEHVPENELDEVLTNIFSRTRKFAFFSISTKRARKTLPNGDNAHCTIKPAEWWTNKIETHWRRDFAFVSIVFDAD